MTGEQSHGPPFYFTEEEASALIGKHLLVGITHCGSDDEIVFLEQFHGTVDRVSREEGLVLKLRPSGEERCLPPDLNGLQRAEPGLYRLKSTGEVVTNPDFTLMWTVYPKACDGE